MIGVRQEYHNHLMQMHKMIEEYNKTKEQIERLEGMLNAQKKKQYEQDALKSNEFPQGTKVFSSDELVDKEAFVIINRDLGHLKRASLEYLKEHELDTSLQQQHIDSWCDYTQELTDRQKKQKAQAQAKKRRNSRNKKPRKRILHAPALPKYDEEVLQQIKDIAFSWPIKRSEFWLSSYFGPRRKANGKIGFHYGIDMAAVRGTLVHPASPGVVIQAHVAPGYGKMVVVAHENNYKTRYAHLDAICVKVGQTVTRATLLGKVGATGNVRSKHGKAGGSHLHFEVEKNGKRINPMYFFA